MANCIEQNYCNQCFYCLINPYKYKVEVVFIQSKRSMVLQIENEEFYSGKYYNSKINQKFRVRCSVHKEETIKQKNIETGFEKKRT